MTDIGFHTWLRVYDTAWALTLPLLRLSNRLKDGFAHRKTEAGLPEADIWIQAASGGEAYLAWTLAKQLRPPGPIRILVTTNTRQGMDILEKAKTELALSNSRLTLFPAWFPFDQPSLMDRAVSKVTPKLAVLLESEMWPGFVSALKDHHCPVLIVNGRMTPKSMSGYLKFPKTCKKLRPDHILAISDNDRVRFQKIFGDNHITVMSNIKFDRLEIAPTDEKTNVILNTAADVPGSVKIDSEINPPPGSPSRLIPMESRFLVLGSVRQEEEVQLSGIIKKIHDARPDVIIGLFPRHLTRLDYWKNRIIELGLRIHLRSGTEVSVVRGGDVILWDIFGELSSAYGMADAVFVGGSLAPLGGQNFLEPLVYGCVPVIGPSYENFAWVGEDIFREKLVIKAENDNDVADHLIRQLENPAKRAETVIKATRFISARQGGTRRACRVIENALAGQ